MQSPVKIRKDDKKIRIYFSYNSDLVEIMQEFKGWYNPKERYWQFPIYKFQEIYDRLKESLYKVDLQNVKFKDGGK